MIPITHDNLVHLTKIENYQQTFFCDNKKKMVQSKTERRVTLESLDFIHQIPDLIRLK